MNNKTKGFLFLPLFVFLLAFVTAAVSPRRSYDIVIYGGGSSGFIAAIQAAESGKSVALVEPASRIGGINIEGLGGTDVDNHNEFKNSPAVGGLALSFYRRIAREYGRLEAFDQALSEKRKAAALWRFEPHVAEKVIREWIAEYDIDVFTNERISENAHAVKKRNGRIRSFVTDKGTRFRGRMFIDASLEGDLLAAAGISSVIGREANSTYSETRNGIRATTTYRQFIVPVDPYLTPGSPASGLIPTIQDEPLGEPGSADHRIQAYCFRVCLTADPANRIPFRKPDNYDRNKYEIYLRYLRAGGKLYTPHANLPNGKTDLGAWHDLSHNLYGMNHGYPGGTYSDRDRIVRYHRDFTEGLFYFLANDPEVGQLDPALQKEWSRWGLPKDEFTDNAGWPRQFYVRDARRMVSDYVITEHHVKKEGGTPVEDPVAMAYWPPDVHSVRRIVREGLAYNEGFVFGGDWWKPFGISYRALVPRRTECTNLIAPACLSSSHIAFGAIRIEFTFMALGQAAANAAVLAIDDKCNVQDVAYKKLKQRLLEQNQGLYLSE